ncbi:MAG: hypothetical protein NTX71_10955 [Candidatus Aureabacteria bacterium]|nr:hypothetical protein [Candidatus Auribacterota bacterium]
MTQQVSSLVGRSLVGELLAGRFVYTIDCVDIATCRMEQTLFICFYSYFRLLPDFCDPKSMLYLPPPVKGEVRRGWNYS